MLTDNLLIDNGFQKIVLINAILFSKRIPGTYSDFIVLKNENGLFYAPSIHIPGKQDEMIALPNQDNLISMDEVNSYFKLEVKKLNAKTL